MAARGEEVTPDFLKYYNDSNIDLCAGGPTDSDELDVEDIFAELSSQIISNLARDTVEDVVRFQQHHAAKESARAKEDALDDGKAAPVEAEDEGAPNEVAVAAAMGRAERALWADIDFGTSPSFVYCSVSIQASRILQYLSIAYFKSPSMFPNTHAIGSYVYLSLTNPR